MLMSRILVNKDIGEKETDRWIDGRTDGQMEADRHTQLGTS